MALNMPAQSASAQLIPTTIQLSPVQKTHNFWDSSKFLGTLSITKVPERIRHVHYQEVDWQHFAWRLGRGYQKYFLYPVWC